MQIPEHLEFHSSRGNLIYVTALKKIETKRKTRTAVRVFYLKMLGSPLQFLLTTDTILSPDPETAVPQKESLPRYSGQK